MFFTVHMHVHFAVHVHMIVGVHIYKYICELERSAINCCTLQSTTVLVQYAYNPVQYSTLQYSTVQYSTPSSLHYSRVQAAKYITVRTTHTVELSRVHLIQHTTYTS